MSVTESKAKAPVKTSKKSVNPAESAALKAALEAAQVEMVPLSALVKSPLNVRTIPYPADSVREMADSIMAIGLIQNLVVHSLPDGMSGVAAGGRRLAALQQLLSEQRIDAGYLVVAKRVSDDLAMVASMVENNQRVAMHPAEQISGFRTLSEEGKTPAQIGDLLGYSARHVQRMLKLANLAPELITLLAEDKLDVEQCQALSLESDPARQVQVYDQVKTSYGSTPAHLLKRAITDTEIAVTHSRFVFIGREAYEAAGGVVREDLFSAQEGDGTADGVLVERLVQEKLAAAALAIEQQEGWSWSLAREGSVRNYGDDREHYLVLPAPEGEFSAEELQRLDKLYATLEATETFEYEAAIQVLIDEIENAASVRAWTSENWPPGARRERVRDPGDELPSGERSGNGLPLVQCGQLRQPAEPGALHLLPLCHHADADGGGPGEDPERSQPEIHGRGEEKQNLLREVLSERDKGNAGVGRYPPATGDQPDLPGVLLL
ncbi:hypothetical protein NUKP38_48070 [Klebsiella variicola]|nr:hypothetical protein NUKP38_48070 [Klebsiella variicola]